MLSQLLNQNRIVYRTEWLHFVAGLVQQVEVILVFKEYRPLVIGEELEDGVKILVEGAVEDKFVVPELIVERVGLMLGHDFRSNIGCLCLHVSRNFQTVFGPWTSCLID